MGGEHSKHKRPNQNIKDPNQDDQIGNENEQDYMQEEKGENDPDEYMEQHKLEVAPAHFYSPHEYNEKLKESQPPDVLCLADPYNTTQHKNYIRVVSLSDTHTYHDYLPKLPPANILIHAGDFTNIGLQEDMDSFCNYMSSQKQHFEDVICIAGNHDVSLDEETYPSFLYEKFHGRRNYPRLDPVKLKEQLCSASTYLEDSNCTTKSNLKVYGSPWQPEFGGWGFNLLRGKQIREKWKLIPSNIDILVTHGPPVGHGDHCDHGGRAGCVDLYEEMETRIRPRVHIFGHIHEGYGATTNNFCTFINASNCNRRYDKNNLNPPIVFDIRKFT